MNSEQVLDIRKYKESTSSSLWARWKILVSLTIVNVLLTLDRTIPQMVVEPMRKELGLSDGEIGVVLGIVFGIFFGISGILVGPLIDRVNRVRFLSAALAIWSGFTFVTGLSWNYMTLLLARGGLGAAEAGAMPAALSVLGDSFPPNRRSTAVGIFKIGIPLGIFAASVIVGTIGAAFGWRACFFVAGIPGFIVAIAVLIWIKEPKRGAMENEVDSTSAIPYRKVLYFMFHDARLTPFFIGYMLAILAGSAFGGFVAAFLQRHHDLSLEDVGFYYGLGSALSVVSPILIGIAADRIVEKSKVGIFYFLSGLVICIVLCALATIFIHKLVLVVSAFIAWQFLAYALAAPCLSAVITLTPVGIRGSILALVGVANMCIGFGLGPVLVGYLSDFIGNGQSLRYALAIVVGVSGIIAACLFLVTARHAKTYERQTGF